MILNTYVINLFEHFVSECIEYLDPYFNTIIKLDFQKWIKFLSKLWLCFCESIIVSAGTRKVFYMKEISFD